MNPISGPTTGKLPADIGNSIEPAPLHRRHHHTTDANRLCPRRHSSTVAIKLGSIQMTVSVDQHGQM
jgi:hypothetical protein